MPSNASPDDSYSYIGDELDLFAHAVVWKQYWSSMIRPYLHGAVLEVGAGTGTNTHVLATGEFERWTCLEPDPSLAARLEGSIATLPSKPANLRVVNGTLSNLPRGERYDTILYIDVLEHIEGDRQEVEDAFGALNAGGHLIVLSPAHQFLYTAFDKGLGHFRRYTRTTLKACSPGGHSPVRLIYLDSVGLLASLGNRLLLNQALPTVDQIKFWDRCLVRLSRSLDPLVRFSLGKSVLGIWQKPSDS